MAIENSIIFGGVNSADFGIYISGEGVFNAPKRDVEMITIPGRNGAFALDNGRFENIEVTYPAFNFEPNDYDTFAQRLSDFRNAICAQRGYQRLEDTFHPDEYRMAAYIGGLDIKPIKYNTASEFDIVFDCKPQRWLTSGETAVTVTSGDTLTNTTLFESSPFLEVEGEGIINFNGYEIDLEGVPYGEVIISDPPPAWHISTVTVTLDTTLLNIGDTIYPQVKDCDIMARIQKTSGANLYLNSVSSATNILEVKSASHTGTRGDEFHIYLYPDFGDGFVYGTSKTITCTAVIIYRVGVNPASTPTYTETIEITITYDGADTYTIAASGTGTLPPNNTRLNCKIGVPTMYGNSTKAVSDVPIYIDCDLGEAYIIIDGAYVSLNHRIDLGSELPTLGVGANEVTFDSTITELKVTPRWWKV